jgi:hypothetical protein
MAASIRIARLTFEVPPATQFAYPVDDISDGLWKNEIGSNTNLYVSVADASTPGAPNDGSWIQSDANPVDDLCVLKLTELATPVAGSVFVRIRAKWVEAT